jgi:hypothetical protein
MRAVITLEIRNRLACEQLRHVGGGWRFVVGSRAFVGLPRWRRMPAASTSRYHKGHEGSHKDTFGLALETEDKAALLASVRSR